MTDNGVGYMSFSTIASISILYGIVFFLYGSFVDSTKNQRQNSLYITIAIAILVAVSDFLTAMRGNPGTPRLGRGFIGLTHMVLRAVTMGLNGLFGGCPKVTKA